MLMICVHVYDKYYFPDNEEIKSTTINQGDSYTYIDYFCTSIRVNTISFSLRWVAKSPKNKSLVTVDGLVFENVTKLVYKDNLISSVYNLSLN